MVSHLPEAFGELLTLKFDSALTSGHIAFTPSTSEVLDTKIKVQLTLIDSLEHRPVKGSIAANPFEQPEPELTVVPEFGAFRVVLNKFPVVRNHFMLVTSRFASQNAPLSPSDLVAILETLVASRKGTGERHFAFFNCGPESGASQPHKHIQFMRLPPASTGFMPFPDTLAQSSPAFIPSVSQEPLQHKDLPFAHFVGVFPSEADTTSGLPLDEEALALYYISLLQRVLTIMRENDRSTPSYNFVMTEQWMMLVPRAVGAYASDELTLGVNSCGVLGMLLVKNQALYDLVKHVGPLAILEQVGFPSTAGLSTDEYHY